MATAYGYYEATHPEGNTRTLCFVCAVREATLEHVSNTIAFQCDEYEFHKCATCGNFIEDRVEI